MEADFSVGERTFPSSAPPSVGPEPLAAGVCLGRPFKNHFLHLYFSSAETRVQRGLVTCPRMHSKLVTEPGLEGRSPAEASSAFHASHPFSWSL